jgi:SsrA-binding protein
MSIVENRRARFEYHLEEEYEAGMVLEGWEVKAVRSGQVQLTGSYVVVKDGELFLVGCQINPLREASTHVRPEQLRTRKLLLKKPEIRRLVGKTEQKGYTLVPMDLHYKGGPRQARGREKAGVGEGEGPAHAAQDFFSQGVTPEGGARRSSPSRAPSAR